MSLQVFMDYAGAYRSCVGACIHAVSDAVHTFNWQYFFSRFGSELLHTCVYCSPTGPTVVGIFKMIDNYYDYAVTIFLTRQVNELAPCCGGGVKLRSLKVKCDFLRHFFSKKLFCCY